MIAFASRFSARIICAAVCCLFLQSAQAFGPQTHAWLAQRLLSDIGRDCRLDIAGRRYSVNPESCAAIRDNPSYFMAGATGSTKFPDPVVARLTLRQGVSKGWSSGEWLQQLVEQADSPQSLAFAWGLVFQAGQEVFANSYVNAFAGAAFSLQADDDVLQRYMAIERYIDSHLPAAAQVSAPSRLPLEFLSAFYLENPQVLAQYRQLPAAAHLTAMHDLPVALQASMQEMESVQIMAAEMLAYYGRMPLSHDALREEFGSNPVVRAELVISAASNESRWLNAKASQSRYQSALSQADEKKENLNSAHAALLQKINEQEKQLLKLPSLVKQEDCHTVRKWISSKEWTNNRVCQKTAIANPARSKARARIDADRSRLTALNMQRQQEGQQRQMISADLSSANAELQAAEVARQEKISDPDSLTALLMRRTDAMQSLRVALSTLDELSVLGLQWQSDMVDAGDDYLRIAASDVQAYRHWLGCSGRAFLAQPLTAQQTCEEAVSAQQMQDVLGRLELVLRVESLRPLREQYEMVSRHSGLALQQHLATTTKALNDLVAETSPLARLSRLESAQPASREHLQDMLATAGAGQQALLTVRNGADLIDADAGIKQAGPLDAEAFNALQYAERFSRMALLPGPELNRLAGRTAGWYFARWPLHPEADVKRYSLLFTALRSMDGNQQWQPYGLPYARAAGAAEPQQAEQRHFGYGPADGADAGLAIFIDADARREVFLNLFPHRLSLLETHPRMQAPNYPFPSCAAHPFPVTFTRAGNASAADNSCAPRELVQH
ncbi:MAG: hypothetical protein ACRERR_06640 [Moraxellaceae bacterium]